MLEAARNALMAAYKQGLLSKGTLNPNPYSATDARAGAWEVGFRGEPFPVDEVMA